MVTPGCCAAVRGAGAHPATQTIATVGAVGAGIDADPSGIVTVLPEFTFDAETTGQAESTGLITSGIWCDAFVQSTDLEALAFEAAVAVRTDRIIVDQAIAIVVHTIANFFSCFHAVATCAANPLINETVTIIIVPITYL